MRKWSLLIVIACFVILLLGVLFQKKQILWNDFFLTESKQPYGLYVLFEQLNQKLTKNVEINKTNISEWKKNDTIIKKNFVFIESDLNIDTISIKKLKILVQKGNNVFLASETFDIKWLEMIGAKCTYFYSDWNSTMDKNKIKAWINGKENNLYDFDKGTIRNVFHKSDDTLILQNIEKQKTNQYIDTLGYVATGKVNFLRLKYGNGYFYFHSNPHCFTNYFLTDTASYKYAFEALALMPKNENWVFDEYYKKHRAIYTSPLRYVLQQTALKWAYYLTLIFLFLYAFISAKRLQREIPVIELPKNASMQFVKTIGDVYYEKGNNKDIVEKRIRYFQEFIRQNLQIHETDFEKQKSILLKKTIHEKSFLDDLFYNIHQAKTNNFSNTEMINFFKNLDEFYKKLKH